MRFAITGEWKQNHLLRLIIWLFLLFVIFFWVTNALLFFDRMGLSLTAIKQHYLGKPNPFGGPVPRSYKVLLEITHAHLFSMGILVVTMTHLVLFVPGSRRLKAWLVIGTFASALLDEAAGWLIRYVHPSFALLKLSMFVLFELLLALIIALLISALVRGYGSTAAYADRQSKRASADDD